MWQCCSSGLWRSVVSYVDTNVSENILSSSSGLRVYTASKPRRKHHFLHRRENLKSLKIWQACEGPICWRHFRSKIVTRLIKKLLWKDLYINIWIYDLTLTLMPRTFRSKPEGPRHTDTTEWCARYCVYMTHQWDSSCLLVRRRYLPCPENGQLEVRAETGYWIGPLGKFVIMQLFPTSCPP
jgi:hypothetical protein